VTIARLLPAAARALRGTLYCCLVGLTLAQPAGAQEPAADAAPSIEMQNPQLSLKLGCPRGIPCRSRLFRADRFYSLIT